MYPHLAQLKMVFVSKLTHVSAMTSHRMPLRTPDHSIVRPLCRYASRYASAIIRIRDGSAKTRRQYERITKGQLKTRFLTNLQRKVGIHGSLPSRKHSFPHWHPTGLVPTAMDSGQFSLCARIAP